MTVLRGDNFLMSPGPTHVPMRVLRAMQRPAVELATPDFVALARSCMEDIKPLFRTSGEVHLYAANGHGAWEAAIVNCLSPGERILVPETGHFSNTWSQMAESFGIVCEHIAGDWRHGIDPQSIEDRLRADSTASIKAVLVIHTDTATGITSDVAAVRAAMDNAAHPALLLVDAVASLATTDFRMDDWRVDVAVGASQKALMAPPGVSFTAAGERAISAGAASSVSRSYWDWAARRHEESYHWFCGTAPEHLIFALREALDMITEEGLEPMFSRHRRLADCVRVAVDAWSAKSGVEINAANPAERADSVTTVRVEGQEFATRVRLTCRDRYNVSLGGGLGALRGKAFRIGHMGDTNEPMLLGALGAVEASLRVCGVPHEPGGTQAAIDYLAANTAPVDPSSG